MYTVPKSKKSLKQNQFEFKINGKEFSIPLLKYMKPSVVAKLGTASPAQVVLALFDEYLGPEVIDEFEDMEQIDAFLTALQEASGVDVGESSASTDS
jgi:hypothetical protein